MAKPAQKEKPATSPVKDAREALREKLSFFIDLEVPGHGDKQSVLVLNAIDDLVRARVAAAGKGIAEGDPGPSFDPDQLVDVIAGKVIKTITTTEGFRAAIESIVLAALDAQTKPADEKSEKGKTNGKN